MAYSSRPIKNPHRKMYVPYVHVEQAFTSKYVVDDPFSSPTGLLPQPGHIPARVTVPNPAPTAEALFAAVRANRAWLVGEMQGRIDFNVLNENHVTPLLIAARLNSLGMVALLLGGGADPSIHDGFGCDPITVATEYENYDMLALLVAALEKTGIAGQNI